MALNSVLAISAGAAVLVALVVCLWADRLGKALGVMDIPDGRRKLHARATPQVGGIAVGVPLCAVLGWQAATTPFTPLFAAMAGGIGASLLLGLVDDRRHVRPLIRLLASVVIAVGVILVVPAERVTFFRFSFFDFAVFPAPWWSYAFTVLCIVGLQNSVNMADGKNGLAVGLLLIWSLLLWTLAPPHLLPALAALVGALGVVLVFNLRGVLFLGDAGTYGISVAVALMTLHVYSGGFINLCADAIALWFLIPVLDALRLMVVRLVSGRSPFAADRRHLHHVLQAVVPGWSSQGRLGFYLALNAIPAALALTFPDLTLVWVALAMTVYASLMALQHVPFGKLGRQPGQAVPNSNQIS